MEETLATYALVRGRGSALWLYMDACVAHDAAYNYSRVLAFDDISVPYTGTLSGSAYLIWRLPLMITRPEDDQ